MSPGLAGFNTTKSRRVLVIIAGFSFFLFLSSLLLFRPASSVVCQESSDEAPRIIIRMRCREGVVVALSFSIAPVSLLLPLLLPAAGYVAARCALWATTPDPAPDFQSKPCYLTERTLLYSCAQSTALFAANRLRDGPQGCELSCWCWRLPHSRSHLRRSLFATHSLSFCHFFL